jgi:putative membrane protein
MTLEALLAYAHFLAILTLVVFISSEAALCRIEWMNAKIVERLAVVDRIYGIAAGAVLLTGIARTWWGIKGTSWYWHQPLLHLKLALFIAVGLMSIKPTIMFIRWRKALRASGALPAEAEVKTARKWVMIQAHIIAVIPLAAVFLARGGTA